MRLRITASGMSNSLNALVVLLAVVVAVGGFFEMPWLSKFQDPAVLSCLALFASIMFVDRHERAQFEQRVLAIAKSRKGVRDLLEQYDDLERLDHRIERVGEIWVSGFVMANFLLRHDAVFRNWFRSRTNRKMLVLFGPEGIEGAKAMNAYCATDSEVLQHEREVAIGKLREFKLEFGEQVQWTFSPVVPPHNLLVLDPEKDGSVQVHLNQFGRPTEQSILFRVDSRESATHFGAFRDEFKAMWKAGVTKH